MAISVVPKKKKIYKKWWFWLLIVLAILFMGAFAFAYKTGLTLNKISSSDKSVLGSLFGVVSNGGDIKQTDDGRTNILSPVLSTYFHPILLFLRSRPKVLLALLVMLIWVPQEACDVIYWAVQ